MTIEIDQTGVSAHGDVVGHDKKTEVHYHPTPPPAGIVEQLLRKLEDEMANDKEVKDTIETLAYYYNRRSHDGIDGLEAKLKAGGRANEYLDALGKKELFVKLLEKWSLYASAQQIFAYLLAKAEHEFNFLIHPQIGKLKPVEVNQLVTETIILPTIAECGSTIFALNHGVAMGMVYWLAEQCYVRWHQ
jgi:hypothetical protein